MIEDDKEIEQMQKLLDTADVARRLHVHEVTVRRWRTEGRGPAFVRAGGRIRYRPESLERWIAEHEAYV